MSHFWIKNCINVSLVGIFPLQLFVLPYRRPYFNSLSGSGYMLSFCYWPTGISWPSLLSTTFPAAHLRLGPLKKIPHSMGNSSRWLPDLHAGVLETVLPWLATMSSRSTVNHLYISNSLCLLFENVKLAPFIYCECDASPICIEDVMIAPYVYWECDANPICLLTMSC